MKNEPQYFFGEKYRTCLDYVHIVEAAKLVLLLDIIKLVLETVYFTSKIGSFDSITVVQLSWAVVGVLCCMIGFCRQHYYYLWPFISLKITECILCLICMFGILILVIMSTVGNSLLKTLILWKYRRVEEDDAKEFSLLLFILLAVLLVFNSVVFDIFFRTQRYFRKKAMAIYLRERSEVIRILI